MGMAFLDQLAIALVELLWVNRSPDIIHLDH